MNRTRKFVGLWTLAIALIVFAAWLWLPSPSQARDSNRFGGGDPLETYYMDHHGEEYKGQGEVVLPAGEKFVDGRITFEMGLMGFVVTTKPGNIYDKAEMYTLYYSNRDVTRKVIVQEQDFGSYFRDMVP
jgi:hypothetical protein